MKPETAASTTPAGRAPRAVIFDMDGVIVDSEPRHERAFLDVIGEIGFADRHGIRFADYVGRSDQELWVDFVALNRPSQTFDELLAMKRERVIEIIRRERPIFDGFLDLVRQLRPEYRLGVASGSEKVIIDEVLALEGLRSFFGAVVSSSEVERGKPQPDIFLRTAALLGVDPRDCWVVEDSKPGIAAGIAAGMKVVAITNTHPAGELAGAHFVVSTYGEIGRLLLPSQ